ncbi:hypothetical protein LCGC14_0320200 [marine sediment metagenome]|uniref:Uncharacterized protein n=1 Tax=marine sediment metagenome TaxID=412755 RepID=A0A0F9U285_9ZZZZ
MTTADIRERLKLISPELRATEGSEMRAITVLMDALDDVCDVIDDQETRIVQLEGVLASYQKALGTPNELAEATAALIKARK